MIAATSLVHWRLLMTLSFILNGCWGASFAVTSTSKAGLGWPNGNTVDIGQFESAKVSWYYTWSPSPTSGNLEFVPMLWGNTSISQFSSTIQQTISLQKVVAVLGMNEPEQEGQSNITPQEGAQLWKTYIEPLRANGIRLGSPAPAGEPAGMTWLQDFFTACAGGCTVDFMALHWYGVNASQFISYLNEYHDAFQRPLWVTEWACQNFVNVTAQCSQNDVIQFMNITQSYMDSSDFVERYSWFGAMRDMQGVNPDNALMDSKGIINSLGKQYIGGNGTIIGSTGNILKPLSLQLLFSAIFLIFILL